MGNNNSSVHQTKFFRPEKFANDPFAFRVFVKKKNKFIPGWLKINDDEIIFTRGGSNFQFWSLAHLRRYGYTCSGVFFFESGRRCATGEGLHTFQSHQAERIFHMVQSKIKIEEYARGSRAGSVSSGRVNSLIPNPSSGSRIHPVQRYSSEGSHNDFSTSNGNLAPPPYNIFQDAQRAQQNSSPNCPSVISSVSAYAQTANLRERPCSVVSNIEHNLIHNNNSNIDVKGMQQPRQNSIQGNASSSTLLQHMMQKQQPYSYALPPRVNSIASASGSFIMNQSFHSALDSGSPWASQQQLDGEIVMEHVLNNDVRRHVPRPDVYNNIGPVNVAVPPTIQSAQTTLYFRPNMVRTDMHQSEQKNQRHAYVNVDLSNNQQQQNGGLNVRELHRTDKSRLEFLSTGPGAFQLPSNGSNVPMYSSTSGSLFVQPPLMQHSFHQCYSDVPSHNTLHYQQSFPKIISPKEHLMSQSMSGALPPCGKFYGNNLNDSATLLASVSPDQRMSMSLNYAVIDTEKGNIGMRVGSGNCRLRPSQDQIDASNSTLITSSTNTMATGN